MRRRSSPGAYSLCSANSTLCPWWGERCRPESRPSTTDRVRSWRVPSLARSLGSSSEPATSLSKEAVHDLVAVDALGLGREVQVDAVTEHRLGQGLDVLSFGGEAPVQRGARLGGEDEELRGARPGAPGDVLADVFGRVGLGGTAAPRQAHRVADGILLHRHAEDELLQLEDLLRPEDLFQLLARG